MKKMSYQEAQAIKKMPALSELIRRNAVGGKSAGQSVKAAFKEKFNYGRRIQAQAVRIKEKFDPLNIAKFLTGGSKLAPALLGRMMGRSQEDIEYFAGKARPIGPRGTADKIGALPGQESNGLSKTLNRIYKLLAKSRDDGNRRRQLSANRNEERQLEDERRHRELLAALGYTEPPKETATPIKEPKTEKGGSLSSALSFLAGSISDLRKWVTDMFANFDIMKYLNKFSWAVSLFKFLGSRLFTAVLMNPAVLAIASGAALVAYLVKQTEEASIYDEEGNLTAVGKTLNAIQKSVGGQGIDKDPESGPFDKIMAEGGTATADKAFKKSWLEKRDAGVSVLPEEAQAIKVKYNIDWPPAQITSSVNVDATASPTGDIESTQATPAGQEVKGYLKRKRALTESEAKDIERASTSPNTSTTPPPPAPTDNKGTDLVTATQKNVKAKLGTMNRITKEIINNNTNVSNSGSVGVPILKPMPAVRNQEETFQLMIYRSTRVV